MTRANGLIVFLAAAALVAMAAGCDEHAPVNDNASVQRNNVNAQNTALSQEKFSELSPAEGRYVGQMMFSKQIGANGQREITPYECILTVNRVVETVRATDQPTETVEVPKLGGSLTCPILTQPEAQNSHKYDDLRDALGVNYAVAIDYGNYNPKTHLMTLPYTVPGYPAGNYFGYLTGQLVGGRFVGTWFVKPKGVVASFDLPLR